METHRTPRHYTKPYPPGNYQKKKLKPSPWDSNTLLALKKGNIIETRVRNHKMKLNVFDKSFVQGIITVTICSKDETILVRRYVKALEKLPKNKNVTITKPDINIYKNTYEKIELPLGDPNTYVKNQEHITETQIFNKSVEKLVTNEEKS